MTARDDIGHDTNIKSTDEELIWTCNTDELIKEITVKRMDSKENKDGTQFRHILQCMGCICWCATRTHTSLVKSDINVFRRKRILARHVTWHVQSLWKTW